MIESKMTRKFIKASLFMSGIFFFAGCVAIYGSIFWWNHVQYSGKFNATHEQYVQFKTLAVNSNYDIGRLQIMNSEPPVYIDFSITIPSSETFPFGERIEAPGLVAGIGLIIVAALCFLGSWRWIHDFGFIEVNTGIK
jgi:hypothetical protein